VQKEYHEQRRRLYPAKVGLAGGQMARLGDGGTTWDRKNFKIGRSDNSNPKLQNLKVNLAHSKRISNWALRATGGPDGSTDYEAEFLVFRDNRAHFVAGMQTICDDLLQPGPGLVQLLQHDSKFVNEIRPAFRSLSFGIVCCRGKPRA